VLKSDYLDDFLKMEPAVTPFKLAEAFIETTCEELWLRLRPSTPLQPEKDV